MKVKMLQGMSGPNINLRPGDEYETTDSEGARLCERGIATPVKQRRKKTVVEPVEKAVIE